MSLGGRTGPRVKAVLLALHTAHCTLRTAHGCWTRRYKNFPQAFSCKIQCLSGYLGRYFALYGVVEDGGWIGLPSGSRAMISNGGFLA